VIPYTTLNIDRSEDNKISDFDWMSFVREEPLEISDIDLKLDFPLFSTLGRFK